MSRKPSPLHTVRAKCLRPLVKMLLFAFLSNFTHIKFFNTNDLSAQQSEGKAEIFECLHEFQNLVCPFFAVMTVGHQPYKSV